MSVSFARFLDYALSQLDVSFAGEAAINALRTRAAALAPLFWVGFEVRLNSDPRIDFHQGIKLANDDLTRLIGYLRSGVTLGDPVLEERLADIAVAPWLSTIDYLVLEFDIDGPTGGRAPGVFFAFNDGADRLSRRAAAMDLLQLFGVGHELKRRIRNCFDLCEGREQISHIALMVGRGCEQLRINLRNIGPERLAYLLPELGYSQPGADMDELFRTYLRVVDRINICLDIGASGAGNLGFECTLLNPPAEEPRFVQLFELLSQRELCLPEKAAAVLDWPGLLSPAHNIEAWPEELLIEALIKPDNHFSMFEKSLSHVKLSYGDSGRLQAKAYLGFGHVWRALVAESSPPVSSEMDTASLPSLEESLQCAVTFLFNSRHQSGWWQDYPDAPIGVSDEWVTAYVGYVLSTIGQTATQTAAASAWSLLQSCSRAEGGWGWSGEIAADADTTIWAVLLARNLGVLQSSLAEPIAFLLKHQLGEGGMATYEATYFKGFHKGGKRVGDRLEEWFSSHCCVTAAGAGISELNDGALDYLRRHQGADGHWPSYWWCDPAFATALAVRALAEAAQTQDRLLILKAVGLSLQRCGSADSIAAMTAFGAACHLLVLSCSGVSGVAAAGDLVHKLLETQNSDGGWPATALLLPILTGIDKVERDRYRNHTTATVLLALTEYRDKLLP